MHRREPSPEEIAQEKLYRGMGLTDEEYVRVCQHLNRQPNYVETGIFSAMWSEHCSYKNSKPLLKRFPTEGPRVLQGPGEGAGVVDIGDGQAVVFKIESHNSPSAVEPYEGAATGVGGIIRDVFSMGARPIALLNSLRFGALDDPHVRHLFAQVVAGIADYGNRIGIPTVGGEVVFEDTYRNNPLVNAMCVGLIPHDKVQSGVAKGVGNSVVYIGAPTGRDGIHGATFSSETLSETAAEERPAVQAGDPFTEKMLLEACLELVGLGVVTGMQDMGAAGLTSASAEMAAKAGNGMALHLDRVPQREEGMTPYELMLSESQERMLLVVAKENEPHVQDVCEKRGLPMAVIGRVTADRHLRLRHKGEEVCALPVRALVDEAPVYERKVTVPSSYREYPPRTAINDRLQTDDYIGALRQLLRSPTVASKRWVYEQYDLTAQAKTMVPPGSDAAVIHLPGTRKALAMVTDGHGRYVSLDPHTGGAIAVAEAARNVVCAGAEPLALTNGLNFGDPEKEEVFWQLSKAVEGMSEACEVLETPVTGGNVSLYNETEGKAIFPTPIVGMIGLVHHTAHITTQAFSREGDAILLLGETFAELGGSEWQHIRVGEPSGRPPRLDLQKERAVQHVALEAIQRGWVETAHDLAEGGLGVALSEACIGHGFGAAITMKTALTPTELLFSESQSRILLAASGEHVENIIDLATAHGVPVARLGEVTEAGTPLQITINDSIALQEDVEELKALWEGAIPCQMQQSLTS